MNGIILKKTIYLIRKVTDFDPNQEQLKVGNAKRIKNTTAKSEV